MNTNNRSSDRVPLTPEELERMTANDLHGMKLDDRERAILRDINTKREQERLERVSKTYIEAEALLAELREAGVEIRSASGLSGISKKDKRAIPVLLKHLEFDYSDSLKSAIAQSLNVIDKKVHDAWPVLVREYRKAPSGRGVVAPDDSREFQLRAKETLAWLLSSIATADNLDELIDLARDKANGVSRIFLLPHIRKSRSKKARELLIGLGFDPDLEREISSWSRKKPKPSTH
jgi:hypothetical protein